MRIDTNIEMIHSSVGNLLGLPNESTRKRRTAAEMDLMKVGLRGCVTRLGNLYDRAS